MEETTYPSGRVVRSCGNAAGQLTSVTGLTTNGMTARTYATGGQYEADGGLKAVTIGALQETRTYNGSRQVETIGLKKGTAGVWNLTNYYCGFDLGVLDCAMNNGNVMKQVVQQPKPPSEGGSLQFTMKYGYDGVNRLSSAQEELATNANEAAYRQTFGYDQYGNRWVTGMTPVMPTGTPNGPTWFNGKNQVMGVGTVYDAAGNLSVLGSGSHAFQRDVEGRKVEDAIVSGGTTYRTWYAYECAGRPAESRG